MVEWLACGYDHVAGARISDAGAGGRVDRSPLAIPLAAKTTAQAHDEEEHGTGDDRYEHPCKQFK
jgi:hypothetical protein